MFRVFLLWANVRQKVGRGPKDDAIESLGFGERTTASLFESEVVDKEDREERKKAKRDTKYQDPKRMANPFGCLKFEGKKKHLESRSGPRCPISLSSIRQKKSWHSRALVLALGYP